MAKDTISGIITQIDRDLSEFTHQRALISKLSPSLSPEVESAIEKFNKNYKESLKQISLGNRKDSATDLEYIRQSILKEQTNLLKKSAEISIQRSEQKIRSPFWTGERIPHLESIEKIRNYTDNLDSTTTRKEIQNLHNALQDAFALEKRIEDDEQRAQVRTPFRVLIWGAPIVVGLWVSDKLSPLQNTLAAGALIIAVMAAYIETRFKIISRINFTKISAARFLSYTPVFLPLIAGLGGFCLVFFPYFMESLVESKMNIKIEEPLTPLEKGTETKIPLQLEFDHSDPAVGVSVFLETPALEGKMGDRRFNVISRDHGVNTFFAIKAPPDLPNGRYQVGVRVRFTSTHWRSLIGLWKEVPSQTYRKEEFVYISIK